MQVAFINDVPLFYSDRDGHWFPALRILHQYPDMMPKLRTDKGAIKFVLSGANIMCPGLTSPGATIHNEVCGLSMGASFSAGAARQLLLQQSGTEKPFVQRLSEPAQQPAS